MNTETDSILPLLELRVEHSAGETLSADTDALEHTVTLQLVQNQFGVQLDCKKTRSHLCFHRDFLDVEMCKKSIKAREEAEAFVSCA